MTRIICKQGILAALEMFDSHIGLKLAYILVGLAIVASKYLLAKDVFFFQEEFSSINLFLRMRQRTSESFDHSYGGIVNVTEDQQIGPPKPPKYRRPPLR